MDEQPGRYIADQAQGSGGDSGNQPGHDYGTGAHMPAGPPQDVAATAREISTVSMRMARSTCRLMTSFALRDITASDVGP